MDFCRICDLPLCGDPGHLLRHPVGNLPLCLACWFGYGPHKAADDDCRDFVI